jgi:hypothetical protein
LPAGSFGGSVDAQFDDDYQSGSSRAAHSSTAAVTGGGQVSSMNASGSASGTVFAEFQSAFNCTRAGGSAQGRFDFTVTAPLAYSISGSATENSSGSSFANIVLRGPGGDVYVLDSLGGAEGSPSGILPPGGYTMTGYASALARVAMLDEGLTSATDEASFSFSLTLGSP